MRHPPSNDEKAHPAGRVLGEAIWTLRTDNAGRGMQAGFDNILVRVAAEIIERRKTQYPAFHELA